MTLGRIIEISETILNRIEKKIKDLYAVTDGSGESILSVLMSDIDRLDVLRSKAEWYEGRFVVDQWDCTISEARWLLLGLERRRNLFSIIADGYTRNDGGSPLVFTRGLDEQAVRSSLAALTEEETELRAAIEDTVWSSEVIDAEIDAALGVDEDVRRSTRGVDLPAAVVPAPDLPVAPVVPAIPVLVDEDGVIDERCSICLSPHRRVIENFAMSVGGDVMATLDFASKNCEDPGLTPRDVTMHLDDHAPLAVRENRRVGPR